MSSRRTTWMGIGTLAVAAVVATPLLLRDGDDVRRPPAPVVGGLPAGALGGDVDGDGTPDVVTLHRSDMLRVRLGSGSTVGQLLQDDPRLEGLADVGGEGLAVITSRRGAAHARDWKVWVVRDDRLIALGTRHRAVIGSDPGDSTAWVVGHRLYDGTLDPLQHRADHVALASRAWALHAGRLTPTQVGLRCWDRTADAPPAICAPGQDWTYDAGPHARLPKLLPSVHPAFADRVRTAFGEDHWSVRNLDPSADPESVAYDVVHEHRGTIHSARVPEGWAPSLFRSAVDLGTASHGLLLSQEGGDSDTWRVYVDRGGRVQPVATHGPLPLGGGFTTSGGLRVYYSWLTPDGRLYTRVGTRTPGHFRVYAWLPSGGDAATPPTLLAHDLGTVCLDELLDTYGTCH